MHTATLLLEMPFKEPYAILFFNQSPDKLIVACSDDILIIDASTQSTQPFSSTAQGVYYCPHALALSDNDAILVAGNAYSVSGYDTASRTRLWIYDTTFGVGAVRMFDAQVLVTVWGKSTLVLDLSTGAEIAALQKADGDIFGLGVIDGLCFILNRYHPLRHPHIRRPRHAATLPLQASQAYAFAAGNVGLDCEVLLVVVVGCCDVHPCCFTQSVTNTVALGFSLLSMFVTICAYAKQQKDNALCDLEDLSCRHHDGRTCNC